MVRRVYTVGELMATLLRLHPSTKVYIQTCNGEFWSYSPMVHISGLRFTGVTHGDLETETITSDTRVISLEPAGD